MKKSQIIKSVFGLIGRVNPSYFFVLIFNSLTRSGQILVNAILPKFIIDELMGARDPKRLISHIAIHIAANLLLAFLNKTAKRLADVSEKKTFYLIDRTFSKKLMSIGYKNLEDPHCLDLKERATFAIENQSAVSQLISNTFILVGELFTVIGLVAVMFTLSWVLVVGLLVTVGIILAIQSAFAKYQQKFFQEILPTNRRYGYYVGLTYDKAIHKDARLYDMTGLVCGAVQDYGVEINTWFSRFWRNMGLCYGLFEIVTVLQTVFAYAYVGSRTLGGAIGIGSLTMYVASAIGFASSVTNLGASIVNANQMLNYLIPFSELMAIPDDNEVYGDRKLEQIGEIRFENVTFSYPKTDKKVLDNISFTISGGEKISIVGRNGAGKSTIVKLIARLYEPNEGIIFINGIDVREYDRDSYLAAVSAVFQDFRLFDFSVLENITCSDPTPDRARAEKLVADVGMSERVAELPNGLDTLIGREYDEDGCEFSGGQAQKIAIARAMYKDSPLVILDEPTSALDPKSEAEIYENFNALVGDCTTIYISHRMSSAHFCDRILVLSDGVIEAFDTHANLMKNVQGTYCRLFTAQAENYREDD